MTDTCPHCDYEPDSNDDQIDHVHDEHQDELNSVYFGVVGA